MLLKTDHYIFMCSLCNQKGRKRTVDIGVDRIKLEESLK